MADANDNPADITARLAAAVREGRPAATATILTGDRAGAKTLFLFPTPGVADETDESYGSLGGAVDPATVLEIARSQCEAQRSARVPVTNGAGEAVDLFIEVFPRPPLLVIFGAVHAAQALCTLAKQLGYYVVVIDARGALATAERFPDANQIIVEWPDDALPTMPVTAMTDIAVLTHDPKFDEPALIGALGTEARYIGAIGSRSTNRERFQRLRDAGVPDEQLARIHAPIGLNIGAESPEEMAVAIMAEIIANRRGRPGGSLATATGAIRNAD